MRGWLVGLVLLGAVVRLTVGGVPAAVMAATPRQGRPGLDSGAEESILSSLVELMRAEARAMQVAGRALQQPTPAGVADEADRTGEEVRRAVESYVRAVEPVLRLPERLLGM